MKSEILILKNVDLVSTDLLFYGPVNTIKDKSKAVSYRNDPKFLDRYAWANSADPDQTAVWSGSTLFAIPSASFGLITLW